MDKRLHLPFPKKWNHIIAKNCKGIALTAIAANVMLLQTELEKIPGKNLNGFQRNRSTTSQILTIRRTSTSKKSRCNTVVWRFLQSIWFSLQREYTVKIQAYGLLKETFTAIMMLYKNKKAMVRLVDGNTNFVKIVAGVLQRFTFAPNMFIICLDFEHR